MAFTKKEEKKFKVGNIEIIIGDKYVLDNKFDAGAPEALQKIETTKLPFTGSGVQDAVYFDEMKGLYDTGFYENSNCLQRYSDEDRASLVKIYEKVIKAPFEKLKNVDLEPSEKNEFWQNYRYEAYANKQFDTTNPLELMELFQVIIQGTACDKNEKDPFYRNNAQFVVSNPSTVKNKNKEKSKVKLKAITTLNNFADGDRDKLNLVLEFIGRGDNLDKVSSEDLKLIYFELFNDGKAGLEVAEKFLDACDMYEGGDGKTQMEFFYAVNKLFKLRKITKGKRGYETLDGVWLGNTLQDISQFCLDSNKAQYKAIESLIEENPKVRREIK